MARLNDQRLVTVSIMLATVMQVLDTTIANVALPHMQGSLSASTDQITWVLTSYIVAAAIMTPTVGFMAGRLGRRRLFLRSVAGFTVTSGLCGLSGSLDQMVMFRILQGCSAPRWCRCRNRCCWTPTRWRSTARPWRSGAWA